MGTGIQICGLNGCGKSTLGKALAKALGYHFIDNEGLYFAGKEGTSTYSNPRTRDEVERLLLEEIHAHPNFVFAAVRGYYPAVRYDYVVVIQVPKEERLRRVRNRSFGQFGSRMLPGGDLYEQEEAFFRMVSQREDTLVENWLRTLQCPVIRVDGTKPVAENVARIIDLIK